MPSIKSHLQWSLLWAAGVLISNFAVLAMRFSGLSGSKLSNTLETDLFRLFLETPPLRNSLLSLGTIVICLHLLYAMLLHGLHFLITRKAATFPLTRKPGLLSLFLVQATGWCLLLAANSVFFPESIMAGWVQLQDETIAVIAVSLLLLLAAALIVLLLLNVFHAWPKTAIGLVAVAFVPVLAANLLPADSAPTPARHPQGAPPNLVLIGVDSLRKDHLLYFGAPADYFPAMQGFLNESVVHANVLSPVGRTFPALYSILSAEYPHRSRARFNLTPPEMLAGDDLLTFDLEEAGYHNLLAMDEALYANITERYGFHALAGPRPGAHDFLVSSYGDFALLNLVSRTLVVKKLLPHLYGNRAAAYSYQPDDFVSRLERSLRDRPTDRPLFLHTHLCLPHWPFFYAESIFEQDPEIEEATLALDSAAHYVNVLRAADRQVGQILKLLNTYLDPAHTTVVLYSDHGEDLGLDRDRVSHSEQGYRHYALPKYGHGLNIGSPNQNDVFFAIRPPAGVNALPARNESPKSLKELLPTVFARLRAWHPEHARDLPKRLPTSASIVGLETGIAIPELLTGTINRANVVDATIHRYEVSEDGLVQLRHDEWKRLAGRKARGIQHGDWRLVHAPAHFRLEKTDWLIVHPQARSWWHLHEFPDRELAHRLVAHFCAFYSDDPEFAVRNECLTRASQAIARADTAAQPDKNRLSTGKLAEM